ncbi:RNA polymerase sigma factor [Paenibacillus chartarius]|uniref:RNA polymerase sigma factor n=1 Tax=Paenibacillus chartarius TaxID=747481 RepID=A0ABV6DVW7_9BACL
MWSLVMKLSPPYRETVILEAHHGLSEQAISEVLGVSRGTVKSRLHRARARLERMLEGDGRDDK